VTTPGVDDRLVDGRYARRAQLGRGGFGIVWRAHDTLLLRDVAMKEVIFPPILTDEEQAALREKVLREARAAARLGHPAVVTVYDVVEEDGRPFIVMELVDAPNLSEIVHRDGPLSEQRAAEIGLEVLGALTVAHAEGIIHRDVKPGNVMVSATGRVQLADFGIASIIDDPKVSTSGQLAGSPSYMAPEQAQNRPPGPATDLWGLAATLFFAVEGAPPFEKGGAIPTLTSVVMDEPREMERARLLAPLFRDLLRKSPDDRPTVEETRRRLTEVAQASAAEPGPSDRSPTVRYDAEALAGALASAAAAVESSPAGKTDPPSEPDPTAPAPAPAPTAATPPPTTAPPPPSPAPAAVAAPTAPAPTVPAPTVPAAPAGGQSPPPPRPAPAVPESAPAAPIPRRRPASGFRLPTRSIVALVSVAVVAVLAVILATRDRDRGGTAAGQSPATTTAADQTDADDDPLAPPGDATTATEPPAPGTTAPARPRTTAAPADGVPRDWVAYEDPATGYRLSHPPGWTVSTNGSLTDFRDPQSGSYLRVDFTTEPGPSPVAAWENFEPRFAAENPNYERIRIEPTTFKGFDAAIWEFTYTGLGTDLRAADLGFVTGSHGFALNFQTRAESWDDMQDVFDSFQASFQPPDA
jgi:serine/threonine protein kinase